jgi:CPA1 family monovalent cation:H+ antiporter
VHGVEIVLISLLLAVALLGAAAKALNVPYPIVLVLGGLVLGFVPGLPPVRLDPALVLVIFLPPLLYGAAFFANLRDLRADLRVITLLAVGLVLVTAAAVGAVAHAIVPGIPWAAAFTLGAIVAPTDPVAATTVARRLGVPRRTVNILEGESLLNDGTALVAYRVAAGAATTGMWSASDAGLRFVAGGVGGILIGLAAGWVITEVRRRIDDVPIETTISLLSGYASYVPAERIGASGVLAAVATGVYVGWKAPEIASASQRLAGYATWSILTFLLNALLFVLVGLQLPRVIDGLAGRSALDVLWPTLAVVGAVVASRIAWVSVLPFVIRFLDRRPSQVARRASYRERTIIAWSGMRGAVSLAAALALPDSFPERDVIVFITFAVIFATLVLQGLTLPMLIRRLDVHDDGAEAREELEARRRATDAALIRLDELALMEWTREDTVERMRGLYDYRRRRLRARDGDLDDGDETEDYEGRSYRYQKMVREVIEAQHDAIVELRNGGRISNDVMHRLERELDLERERLEI